MIRLQHCPEIVLHARTALSAALHSNPDLPVALALHDALDLIEDVEPPYPPLHDAAPPVAIGGAHRALAVLQQAIADADSSQEAVRLGLASRTLRRALDSETT